MEIVRKNYPGIALQSSPHPQAKLYSMSEVAFE